VNSAPTLPAALSSRPRASQNRKRRVTAEAIRQGDHHRRGAFSEAYGDHGYTLVLEADRTLLALHHHFESVETAIRTGTDIIPSVNLIRQSTPARRVGNTEARRGDAPPHRMLECLMQAYRHNLLPHLRRPSPCGCRLGCHLLCEGTMPASAEKKASLRHVPKNILDDSRIPRGAVTLSDSRTPWSASRRHILPKKWDNVGLLSGHRSSLIKKVLLSIDITPAVHDEAIRLGVDLVLSYHPPIFKPIKHLRIDGDEPPALAIALASYGIWTYSPHTALDTVRGWYQRCTGSPPGSDHNRLFFALSRQGEYLKLVAFIPESHVEEVADAVFAAGAGQIGNKAKYSRCSFRNPGRERFRGMPRRIPQSALLAFLKSA